MPRFTMGKSADSSSWCGAINCKNSKHQNPEMSFHRFPSNPAQMDIASFDLEEMDEAEREELEAMLYAQVHHAAPDATPIVETLPPESALTSSDLPDSNSSQLKTPVSNQEAAQGSLPNGRSGHSSPLSVKEKTKAASESESAATTCLPAVTNASPSTASAQDCCDVAVPDAELNSQQAAAFRSRPCADNGKPSVSAKLDTTSSQPVIQVSSTPSPTPADQALPKSDTQALKDPASDISPTRPARVVKRPLSPASSGDEPETKTAALAVDEKRRRGRRPVPPELVTVGDSSSGSATDEYVIEPGKTRPAAIVTAATSAPASDSGVVSSVTVRPRRTSSPDVLTIDQSPSPVPEVISLGEDSQPPSPKPSSSAAAAARPLQKSAVSSRRARSLGGAEALRQRWVRTSSDLSSSGDDSDGGAALVDECDIRMNVRGAGAALSAARDVAGGQVESEAVNNSTLSLPPAACHRLMASAQLTASERRLLAPLCRSQPCHKWSERQRADYTTPRHYGSEDVNSIQAAMSDHGWDIPAEYLQRSVGGRSAKARYYSNLMRNRCRRCDDIGHMMASCPLPPICHLCGGKGHTGEFRCPNMFCYMCGRTDHPTQRCPRRMQQVFCALCKAAGHVSDECSDRWRRYHATTTAGPAVQPPPSLENRPARHVFCWECGQRGHHGHHCGDERYTSAASLSQQVASYTETACASRQVSGIVATPAQMDAVFAPRRRRRVEQETRATLTYEQLSDKSWMINISGSLVAARDAHEHIQAILQGKKRPRPRPNSAPASPVHLTEPEDANSAPVSPEPTLDVEPDGGISESKKAARERRRLMKEARLAERRRRRQARAAARQAAAAVPPVIDVDSMSTGDECVEVTMAGEVPGPAAAQSGGAGVELVTIASDDESLGAAGFEAGSGLGDLTEAGRQWSLTLLDGEGQHDVNAQQQSARQASKLSKQQRKKLRKKMLKNLMASADAEEESSSLPSAPGSAGTSEISFSTPATSQTLPTAAARKPTRRELELRRAKQTKATLAPELLDLLPAGWETVPNWRHVLMVYGVPHGGGVKAAQRAASKRQRAEQKAAKRQRAGEAGKETAAMWKKGRSGKTQGSVKGAGKTGKWKSASAGKMTGGGKVKQENGVAPVAGSSKKSAAQGNHTYFPAGSRS